MTRPSAATFWVPTRPSDRIHTTRSRGPHARGHVFRFIPRKQSLRRANLELLSEEIRLSSERREDDIRRWTQQYADRLAHYSRNATDNWFNFYDFWQDTP